MIRETTRQALGWGGFPGFVFLRDDQPILQLYEFDGGRSKTLFWRGHATVKHLIDALPSLVHDLASFESIPIARLNRFRARYAESDWVNELPYALRGDTAEDHSVIAEHDEFLRVHLADLRFARFDLISQLTTTSVWADLSADSARAEIGVTAPVIARSAFHLFEQTANISLKAAELDGLNELLDYHSDLAAR